MIAEKSTELTDYYRAVQTNGKLLTLEIARKWSNAVLWTLGLNLGRGTKKKLAKALPEELATDLSQGFWLVHFRNKQMPREEFLNSIARRSGHSDTTFARFPTGAVFHELKRFVDDDLIEAVADSLSPEVGDLWTNA